jgi:hypothetical protein
MIHFTSWYTHRVSTLSLVDPLAPVSRPVSCAAELVLTAVLSQGRGSKGSDVSLLFKKLQNI